MYLCNEIAILYRYNENIDNWRKWFHWQFYC